MATTYLVPGTYATIQAAIAAIPSNLSGTGEHIISIAAGNHTTFFEVVGFTNASASDRITIKAAAGAEHLGIPGAGVRIYSTTLDATWSAMGVIETNYTSFENLEFDNDATVISSILLVDAATNISIKNSISKFTRATGVGTSVFLNCQNVCSADIENAIHNNEGTQLDVMLSVNNSSTTININQGLALTRSAFTLNFGSCAGNVRNFVSLPNGGTGGNGFQNTTGLTDIINCAFISSGSGTNPLTTSLASMAFLDSANSLFGITKASTLFDAGFVNTANAAAQDIKNENWVHWPIGAFNVQIIDINWRHKPVDCSRVYASPTSRGMIAAVPLDRPNATSGIDPIRGTIVNDIINTPAFESIVPGQFGYCLQRLGGIADANFIIPEQLISATAYSILFWCQIPGTPTGGGHEMYISTLSANNRIGFRFDSLTTLEVYMENGSGCVGSASLPVTIALDDWHQVAVIFDGAGSTDADRLKVYIDTTQITLSFTGAVPTSGPAFTKAQPFSFGLEVGLFDALAIWDRPIIYEDVALYYNDPFRDYRVYDDFNIEDVMNLKNSGVLGQENRNFIFNHRQTIGGL